MSITPPDPHVQPQPAPATQQTGQIDLNALLRNPIVILLLIGGGGGGIGSIWTMNNKQDRNIEEEIVTRMAVIEVKNRLDKLEKTSANMENSISNMENTLYRLERASASGSISDRDRSLSLRRDGPPVNP